MFSQYRRACKILQYNDPGFKEGCWQSWCQLKEHENLITGKNSKAEEKSDDYLDMGNEMPLVH